MKGFTLAGLFLASFLAGATSCQRTPDAGANATRDEDPDCRSFCDQRQEACNRSCGSGIPGCECRCQNAYWQCLDACGDRVPPPQMCEV